MTSAVAEPDYLDADRLSALGSAPLIVTDAAGWAAPALPIQALIVGSDRAGALPAVDPAAFDLLLTTNSNPRAPWVSVQPDAFDSHLARLETAVRAHPQAATVLAQVLRLTERLPFTEALKVESLAYSTLLGGHEFASWRARQVHSPVMTPPSPVAITRDGDALSLTLNNPAARNAMTAAMRDALYEALANALDDPGAPAVHLRGAGACFSTGGDLGEFGSARELAEAHLVRTLHSCAAALDALGSRASVHVHGACIGSGLEIAAAAAHRSAGADAWFQLPELSMGLIPGAGGTVSVARVIGRHRTAWLALTGARLRAGTALNWGLIHRIGNA